MSLTDDQKRQLDKAIEGLAERPPTIGLVGVSGVGKSSTINRLFRTKLEISHTVACTKEFQDVPLSLRANQGILQGKSLDLIVVDAPGLGEDCDADETYLAMYEKRLVDCDVVLWVSAARNRAAALDQQYLRLLSRFHEKLVFGLSQVDLVEPRDWKAGLPIPSKDQEANIREIVRDRGARFSKALGRKVDLVAYSNEHGYNLESLFTALLEKAPEGRAWVFHSLKGFSFEDFVPSLPGSSSRETPRTEASTGETPRSRERSGQEPPSPPESLFGTFARITQSVINAVDPPSSKETIEGMERRLDDLKRENREK